MATLVGRLWTMPHHNSFRRRHRSSRQKLHQSSLQAGDYIAVLLKKQRHVTAQHAGPTMSQCVLRSQVVPAMGTTWTISWSP
jgi:RNase P protein component